jgi:hypothetical protein
MMFDITSYVRDRENDRVYRFQSCPNQRQFGYKKKGKGKGKRAAIVGKVMEKGVL